MSQQHDEKADVEVVASAPSKDAEVVPLRGTLDRVHSQLERAASFALTNPGTPGVDEFLSLAMQARILAASPLCPKELRGDPHAVFHVGMIGRSLGLSIDAAVELIDVIPSQNGARPSLSPQLVNAQCHRLGIGSIVPVVRTNARCVAMAVGPRGMDKRCMQVPVDGVEVVHVDDCACDVLGYSEFTWEDAIEGRLVLPGCLPGEHSATCKGQNGGRCNQGYITYPKRMLWWRAAGFCADDHLPDALLGLYSPEELGAVVDGEGRPIDPATVELPPGFEDKREAERLREEARNAPAEAEVLVDLQVRVMALPEEQRAELADRWVNIDRLKGVRLATLPAERVKLVESLIRGVETKAKATGWEPEAAQAEVWEVLRDRTVDALAGGWTITGAPPQEPAAGPPSSEMVQEGSQQEEAASEPQGGADEEPAGPFALTDDLLYPLVPPEEVDVDDRSIAEHVPEALVVEVIEAVKALSSTVLNKALRAHGIPVSGENDTRRLRLTLAVLREMQRAGDGRLPL